MITLKATLIEIKDGRAWFDADGRCFTVPVCKEQRAWFYDRAGRALAVMIADEVVAPEEGT